MVDPKKIKKNTCPDYCACEKCTYIEIKTKPIRGLLDPKILFEECLEIMKFLNKKSPLQSYTVICTVKEGLKHIYLKEKYLTKKDIKDTEKICKKEFENMFKKKVVVK